MNRIKKSLRKKCSNNKKVIPGKAKKKLCHFLCRKIFFILIIIVFPFMGARSVWGWPFLSSFRLLLLFCFFFLFLFALLQIRNTFYLTAWTKKQKPNAFHENPTFPTATAYNHSQAHRPQSSTIFHGFAIAHISHQPLFRTFFQMVATGCLKMRTFSVTMWVATHLHLNGSEKLRYPAVWREHTTLSVKNCLHFPIEL
jgi:hypothetical protein